MNKSFSLAHVSSLIYNGYMSKEKKARNKRLFKAVEKYGIRETARRFKLSPATVHEIYWRMKLNI